MKALEAREKVKNNKQNNELEKIYEKIKQAVDFGWHNTFISEFNISIENKNILENDGYFIDTRYSNGFQVRWIETDMNYFLDLVSSNKEHAKINVDDDVIENYKRSAVIGRFSSLEECENEAILFTKDKLKVVSGLLSEDYKIGYKEGVEHYLASKNDL